MSSANTLFWLEIWESGEHFLHSIFRGTAVTTHLSRAGLCRSGFWGAACHTFCEWYLQRCGGNKRRLSDISPIRGFSGLHGSEIWARKSFALMMPCNGALALTGICKTASIEIRLFYIIDHCIYKRYPCWSMPNSQPKVKLDKEMERW